MNWYTKLSQEIIEYPVGTHYTDIGHEEQQGKPPKRPNLMWIYCNGEILVEEENEESMGHGEAFGNLYQKSSYAGRYEQDTGNLSIVAIGENRYILRHRIPSSLMHRLKQKFPNINNIYIF